MLDLNGKVITWLWAHLSVLRSRTVLQINTLQAKHPTKRSNHSRMNEGQTETTYQYKVYVWDTPTERNFNTLYKLSANLCSFNGDKSLISDNTVILRNIPLPFLINVIVEIKQYSSFIFQVDAKRAILYYIIIFFRTYNWL